ncbi:MAG: hypothetical protein RBT61_00485 [Candidatus Kapabacteria bacterium]|jgi:hypothetical protein|nr:hypothetical protein [Candidatus Kapabacteria bacterium]
MNLLKFIDHIDLTYFDGGSFWVLFYHPDDSSIELIGNVEHHGIMIQTDYDSEPYFNGGAVVNVERIITYDSTGAIVSHTNEKEFVKKLNNLVNNC